MSDDNVVDMKSARAKSDAKKREEKRQVDSKKENRSVDRKIKDALSIHGSNKGTAIKDRFTKGKVDLTKKEEDSNGPV